MKCQSCGREIDVFLALSHGRDVTRCPICKKDPTGNKELYVTYENEELCILAENYYYKWLTVPQVGGTTAKESEQMKRQMDKYLAPALRYAERAAAMGNPRATVWMGFFYDKDYLGLGLSEVQRCRLAYNYYRRAIDHAGEFRGEGEDIALDDTKSHALKKRAARLLLDMLAAVPAELAAVSRFDFERNRDEICAKLRMEYTRDENVPRDAMSKTELIFRTLKVSCFSKDRAPLFGFYRLPWEDAKALLQRRVEDRADAKLLLVDNLNAQGISVSCIACSEDGNAVTGVFHALKNGNGLDAAEQELFRNQAQGGEYGRIVWLCFFNASREGAHRFLTYSQVRGVQKALAADEHSLLRALIGHNGRVDCTLFDDDVYCYADGNNWKKALEELSNKIGGTEV